MAKHCTCTTCKKSPAKPKSRDAKSAQPEQIEGAKVEMKDGWTLAHWSDREFRNLYSTEFHNFVQLGDMCWVGASFFLFTTPDVPSEIPKSLVLLNLGGDKRYTIGAEIGKRLDVFYKSRNPGNPPEVAVRLGCGGSITFEDYTATDVNPTDTQPLTQKQKCCIVM